MNRDERMREIQEHALRFGKTHGRDFPALRASGLVSLPLLVQGSGEDPNPAVRRLCLDLIDHLGDETTLPAILAALWDPVPRVRRHAIHALTCVACKPGWSCPDTVPALSRIVLEDDNAKVRAQAQRALAQLTAADR